MTFRMIARRLTTALPSRWAHVFVTLGTPPFKLAGLLFEEHSRYLSDFYEGFSRSNAENAETYNLVADHWNDHFAQLRRVLSALASGPPEMWRIAYYVQVTQEQALADYEETLVESLQTAWLVLFIAPAVVARVDGYGSNLLIPTLSAFATALLLIPTYIKRKRTLALYILHAHAFTFIFGEPADVADREAE